MFMAYSKDLREKVIAYLLDGHTQREARDVFHISLTAINRWNQLYTKTGKLEDEKPRRTFKKLDPEKLKEYVKEHPDAYLQEIGDAFGCSDTAVMKALRRLGITRKKRQRGIGNKNLKE
jgi:transposase